MSVQWSKDSLNRPVRKKQVLVPEFKELFCCWWHDLFFPYHHKISSDWIWIWVCVQHSRRC